MAKVCLYAQPTRDMFIVDEITLWDYIDGVDNYEIMMYFVIYVTIF